MAEADFWSNQEKAQEVVAELKPLKALLKPLDAVIRGGDDLAAMIEMADEDASFAAEVPGEVERLETLLDELEVRLAAERSARRATPPS